MINSWPIHWRLEKLVFDVLFLFIGSGEKKLALAVLVFDKVGSDIKIILD